MDAPEQPDIEALTKMVRELLARVERLERSLSMQATVVERPAEHKVVSIATRSSHTDLESRIGSQWLSRIGIVALLFGVSYFLKYAFENRWIGPAGRVSIGLLAGIAIMLGSEWFRLRGYRVFSFSLKAVAVGVLYLSFWAAFQLYHLIGVTVAFFAMFAVTVATAALAFWEDAEVLAMFSLIGGFLTPVLLYTGQNREVELFFYLAILDCAAWVAAVFKWSRLALVSLAGTLVLYFGWYAAFYNPAELGTTLAFATFFFAGFALTPVLARARSGNHSDVLFTVALINATAYFMAAYLMLTRLGASEMTWCAIALTVFYGILGARFRTAGGSALDHLHLWLALAFATAAIAIQFQSQWITIAWFLEAAALMAIGFGRNSQLARWQGLAVVAAAIAKVFAYDIWRLERGYRIVSFIALGALLLVISFIYQRDWQALSGGKTGRPLTRKSVNG